MLVFWQVPKFRRKRRGTDSGEKNASSRGKFLKSIKEEYMRKKGFFCVTPLVRFVVLANLALTKILVYLHIFTSNHLTNFEGGHFVHVE